MATPLLKTAEEKEVQAEAGVQAIHEFVKALDMPTIVETLRGSARGRFRWLLLEV